MSILRYVLCLCAVVFLASCGTVNRDVSYIASDYEHAEKNVDVTVDSADGPVTLKVRRHPLQKKILVLLDTGSIKRALAKDFGAKDNALPQSVFETAANKRLADAEGANCHTATAMMRQDYMWEFDYVCEPSASIGGSKGRR